MKKKTIALTLSAVLALSSTTAFAAETNCTKVAAKYDFNNLLKNYTSRLCDGNSNCTNGNSNCTNGNSDCKVSDGNSTCKTTNGNSTCTNGNCKVTINGKTVDLNSVDWKALLNKKTCDQPADTEVEKDNTVEEPTAPAENNNTNTNTSVSSYEQKVVELVNVERQKAGLPVLTLDAEISNVARLKSKDMADKNYFAHQSPTYGSAGNMLNQFGIRWSAWGENIAAGQKTPEDVVTAWMNSEGHRANILSAKFSKIAVGYVTNSNGRSYWTQMFTN
ncbi:MAG TPA: hypothetical protein DCM73_00775 [Clostridiales bacterium]|nr:hypothetical protein [Clostridiales bacterium]